MLERYEEHLALATIWTAALATLALALRGGSALLVVMALPLMVAASRVTWLQTRRRPRKRRHGASMAPVARVIRLRSASGSTAEPSPTAERRPTAA